MRYDNKNVMAEEGLSLARKMKELPERNGDLTPDDDDMSVRDDPENLRDTDPNCYEERFRVDRRKLEQMMQACSRGNDRDGATDKAEAFFQKVMDETHTHITWPSKLKIGAKSKKDPHIKVSGLRENVCLAKQRILDVLDTKSNRLTLKMDVSHTDHSHVIGKGGNNIRTVMQETGCHIHFPDSNRSNQLEKSNQVSIAGQPNGVEHARSKVRELLPLVFMFELPMTGLLQPLPDSSSPLVQQIQNTFNVSVTFKQRPRVYVVTVIVRGSVNNAKAVKEATVLLIEQLTGTLANLGSTVPVNMQLEIAPQHHLFMIGRGGANIKQIMQRTGATIHFPDPNTVSPQRKGTVYITGPIESVFMARQQLIGCLPLVLMFDMKDDINIDQGKISQLMEQLDVFISVKPKPKQPSKSVIVKSIEQNASNMYEARRRLLGIIDEPLPVVMPVSSEEMLKNTSVSTSNSFGLAGLGHLNQNLLNMNSTSLQMILNGTSPLGSPTSRPSGLISPSGLYAPMVFMSPSTYGMNMMPQQGNGLIKEPSQPSSPAPTTSTSSSAIVCVPSQSDRGSTAEDSVNGNPLGSPLCNSPIDLLRHAQNTSNSSSQVTERRGLQSSQNYLDIRMSPLDHQPKSPLGLTHSNSHHNLHQVPHTGTGCPSPDLLMLGASRSSLTGSPLHVNHSSLMSSISPSSLGGTLHNSRLGNMSASSGLDSSVLTDPTNSTLRLEDTVRNLTFQNGERASSESGCESDGSDHRAPGSHRPKPLGPPPGLFPPNTSSLFAFDYEQKKLLATKAMQKKPEGESRTPTDLWAGLGFSKSMPATAIREKLQRHNVRYGDSALGRQCQRLEQQNEAEEDEAAASSGQEDWIDRDPWKNSSRLLSPPSPDDDTLSTTSVPSVSSDFNPSHRRLNDYHSPSNSGHLDSSAFLPASSINCKTDLAELFSQLSLTKYIDLFQQQEIDMGTFQTLTDDDLKELGITTFGARKRMLLAIADLNKRQTLIDAAPGSNNPFRKPGIPPVVSYRRHDIVSQSGRW